MKILAFSGLRLGATFPEWPGRGAEIRAALRALLDTIMARAVSEGCCAVLSCGDLFASNAVPLEEVATVTEVSRKYPSVPLVLIPGGRDPWGPYSTYRHLQGSPSENLVLLRPGLSEPIAVGADLFFYGLGVDAGLSTAPSLSSLSRASEGGVHVVAAYGDLGRLKPGPEEGLVMISPEITNHSFSLLIMADGGPAEKLGSAQKPACYAAPAGPFCAPEKGGGSIWKIDVDGGAARLESIAISELQEQEVSIEITGFADLASVAQAIRRKVAPAALVHVILTGTRPADRIFLEPSLHSLCAPETLALRITDRTQLAPPEVASARNAGAVMLWEKFRQCEPDHRQEWLDALKLYAAGIKDPARWKEAPWVRS
jgi:hypothetical protein